MAGIFGTLRAGMGKVGLRWASGSGQGAFQSLVRHTLPAAASTAEEEAASKFAVIRLAGRQHKICKVREMTLPLPRGARRSHLILCLPRLPPP